MRDEDEECTCREDSGIEPHTCPFGEEIKNDYTTLCTCCPYCTKQCAYDI